MSQYLNYISHSMAYIADSRRERAKQAYYDLGGSCEDVLCDEVCIFLMAWSMFIEERGDNIPFLTEVGVGCSKYLCTLNGQIATSGTGLFSSFVGSYSPLINANTVNGLPTTGSGTSSTPVVSGGSGGSGGGSVASTSLTRLTIFVVSAIADMVDGDTVYYHSHLVGATGVMVFVNGTKVSDVPLTALYRFITFDSAAGTITFSHTGVSEGEIVEIYFYT